MNRTALYPGTFDPLTNGHIDLLEGAFRLCDRLVIAVGVHPTKEPMLSVDDRLELINRVATPMGAAAGVTVEVSTFDNLVVDFAREVGARILIRGLRVVSDMDYEFQLASFNRRLYKDVETVFLMPDDQYTYLASSMVREIARLGADADQFVTPFVARKLRLKFGAKPKD